MPGLYPFFHCARCDCRVQMAMECVPGKLPRIVVNDRRIQLSADFDHGDFSIHCRGQGPRYRTQKDALAPGRMDLAHFNFDGQLTGLCCFCAMMLSPINTSACFNCVRKAELRKEFSRLYKLRPGSCLWAALPTTALDKILCAFLGGALSIADAEIVAAPRDE